MDARVIGITDQYESLTHSLDGRSAQSKYSSEEYIVLIAVDRRSWYLIIASALQDSWLCPYFYLQRQLELPLRRLEASGYFYSTQTTPYVT